MQQFPRYRSKRPEALSSKNVRDMVVRPLSDPYIGPPMNRPDLCDFFAGKAFTIYLDGIPELKYRVTGQNTLYWWKNGPEGGWEEEEYYECYESSSKGLYLLFHMVRHDIGNRVRVFAIDSGTRLVTLIAGATGLLDYTPRDTDATPHFGYIDWQDGAAAPSDRHDHTLELMLKNALWKTNAYNQIHYYMTRHYFTYQTFGEENGFVRSERARHIKLRDGVYMFYWRDMQCTGVLSCEIMDLNKFYSVGMTFGVTDYEFVCRGFTREEGRFVSDDELYEFERIFAQTQDQRHALKAVFGVDLDDCVVPQIDF